MTPILFPDLEVGDAIWWCGAQGNLAVVIDTRGGATISWVDTQDYRHTTLLAWNRTRRINIFDRYNERR